MKPTKEQKSNEEIIQTVDVELNEEQLEVVAGGNSIWPTIFIPTIPTRPTEGPA